MANYCLLMTVKKDNGTGNIELGDNKPYWLNADTGVQLPNDPTDKTNPPIFQEGAYVSFGIRILESDGTVTKSLPGDFAIAAIVAAKNGQAKNNSPYRIGAVGSGRPRMLLLGSISGEACSKLVAFNSVGKVADWTPGGGYDWFAFAYPECLLFHSADRTQDSKFEVTLSAELENTWQWAFDPEMDVQKKP